MIKNYLKIAWRNIRKRAQTSIIAVGSLSLGLAVCFVIGLYVLHEWSYDRSVPDADRIVRVIKKSGDGYLAMAPPGLAKALETRIPGMEELTAMYNYGKALITKDNEQFQIENVLMADSNMTKIFPVTTLSGNAEAALNQPDKIILSQSTAKRLFGNEQALGQILTVEIFPGYRFDYEVGAVVKDPPSNLHFGFNAILSLSQPFERKTRYSNTIKWRYAQTYVYVKLPKGITMASFQKRLSYAESKMNKPEEWNKELYLKAQPLTAIHFEKNVGNEIASQGDVRYLYIFSAIGILILGIACFNYMNITTARALPRAGEVGVRKVAGATRSNLIFQFLAEALLTCLIAFPLAICLSELALPWLQQFVGEQFAYSLLSYPQLLLISLGVVIIVGLLSGLYPALVISSFQPASIFRGWGKGRIGTSKLQKSLLVFQFGIAILFLISTIAIHRQLNFIQHTKLGFDKEQVVYFDSSPLQDKYDAFKQELASNASVASITNGLPLGIGWKTMSTSVTDSTGNKKSLNIMQVDYGFVKTMGLTLKKGRAFSRSFGTDKSNGVIINESAVNFFNLGENPIGKTVGISGKDFEVIGLVKDFHNESLKDKIQPVAMLQESRAVTDTQISNSTVLIRLARGNVEKGISDLKKTWTSFLPGRPLDFTFLDEKIEAQYRTEQKQSTLMSAFAGIAILIACIGLLGLAALMTQNRTKEIGIRKVLGATISNIVGLLSKDFLKLVAIGFIIAVPIAWYAMHKWLADFAYKIEIGPGIFLLAGGLALLIALATVSWQSIRAALANPVDSLRSE